MTAKQTAKKVIEGLPDEATRDDLQYQLHVLARVQRGEEQVKAGRVMTAGRVEKGMERWLR